MIEVEIHVAGPRSRPSIFISRTGQETSVIVLCREALRGHGSTIAGSDLEGRHEHCNAQDCSFHGNLWKGQQS